MTKKHLKRRGSSRAGRPREEGDRYPSGKLKPAGFSPERRNSETGAVEARELEGCNIYVIGPRFGPRKIGFASDVQKRLATLQSSNPAELIIQYRIDVGGQARDVEFEAHRLLQDRRLRGEWFNVTLDDAIGAIETAIATATPRRAKLTRGYQIELANQMRAQ